jgi:hypothetical protein
VVPFDPFEPNDESAPTLRLEPGSGESDTTLFHNPALMLESGGTDRYHIETTDPERPVTLLISAVSPALAQFEVDISAGSEPWRIGIRGQECRDSVVNVDNIAPVTVVRALTGLPSGGLEVVVRGPPSRYDMRILDGYRQQDPLIAPDRFEDNDHCVAADEAPKLIDLTQTFSEVVTIDNPYELDWYRFIVPGSTPQLVTIRTRADPFGALDLSDIALFLVTAPQPGTDPLARSDVTGSTELLSLELEPGDYYLLAADRGGAAMRYGLCLSLGNSCPLP